MRNNARPENRLTDAYEPEVGNLPNEDSGRDEENVVKTGTTTVGLSTEDGVISRQTGAPPTVAASSRISRSRRLSRFTRRPR